MNSLEECETHCVNPAPVGIYKKMNGFRADAIQLDWSDDKMMTGKVAYKYLSTDKIKKQLAPILVKHGLEIELDFEDLQFVTPVSPLEKQCIITLKATFIDIDTGEKSSCKVYGEAGDFLDKAVSKAQTFALKEWLSSYLLLVDGIDADMGDTRFQPKAPMETEAVRSKILDNAVKPPAPKPVEQPKAAPVAPKPEPKVEAPVAQKPKEEVKVAPKPKAPLPKAPAPKVPKDVGDKKQEEPVGDTSSEVPEVPSEDESKPVVGKYPLTGIQKKVIDKIIEDWTQMASDHKVTSEQYNNMIYDKTTLSSGEDVRNFISNYKDGPK